jgi:hypothetical protein
MSNSAAMTFASFSSVCSILGLQLWNASSGAPAFCGPTSAAIVLNAIRGRSADLPRDRSRLREEDLRYVPKNYDPTIPRFTQDNVITKGQKTRAQVLGEPLTVENLKRLPGWCIRRRV